MRERVEEDKFGPMEVSMRAFGEMIKLMVRAV